MSHRVFMWACLPCLWTALGASIAHAETIPLIDRTAPVLDGDRAYVTTGDRLCAVDLSRREGLWDRKLPAHTHTRPMLYDDVIGLLTEKGDVVMLDSREGRPRGSFRLPDACADAEWRLRRIVEWGLVSIAPEAGLLLINGERLCAVRVPDGELTWTREGPAVGVAVEGETALVLTGGENERPRLTRIDLHTEAEVLSRQFGETGEQAFYGTGPVLSGDTVLVSVGGRLRAFEADSLELRWETQRGPGGYLGPVVVGDTVMAMYPQTGEWENWNPSALSAYDLATGRQLWSNSYEDTGLSLPGAAGGGNVLALVDDDPRDFNNARRLIAVDAISGEMQWECRPGDIYVLSGPQLHDGRLWMKLGDPHSWQTLPTLIPCGQEIMRGYMMRSIDAATGELGAVIELPSRGSRAEAMLSPTALMVAGIILLGLLAAAVVLRSATPGTEDAQSE